MCSPPPPLQQPSIQDVGIHALSLSPAPASPPRAKVEASAPARSNQGSLPPPVSTFNANAPAWEGSAAVGGAGAPQLCVEAGGEEKGKPSQSKRVCFDYQKGACFRGSNCRFRHVLEWEAVS